MGSSMDQERATVRIVPGARDDVAEAVALAGWHAGEDARVVLADARDGTAAVAAEDARAIARRAALVALVADAAGAARAHDAGATHAAVGLDALAPTLRFAARYVRRMRGEGRRAEEAEAEDDAAAFALAHHGAGVTAMIAALTSFEIVNAAFGRAAGDALVNAAQARLAQALAAHAAIVTRDGSAFTILLAGAPVEAEAALAAVERALAAPFDVGGETIQVGARIGVARAAVDEPSADLLRRAAEALARARGGGGEGATTQVAPDHDGAALSALAADLHRAIERGEIEVRFQPQVALSDGRVAGVEALARWQHPRLGLLGAASLLAAADRAGLGVALSEHLQALALAHVAAWPATLAHLRVAVNVTAADVARAGFADGFLARVGSSGVDPARVTAEITEGGLIDDLEAVAPALQVLRAAGCRVAVDDFGTGYSSLAYLATLPLDYLKIDRALTQDVVAERRRRAVVEGVLAIAAALSLETIAEGVETEEQRALLAARGCTYYQGFLCAEPLNDAGLVALVAGNASN
ncbi:EAL domain-containing protein [Sphingomonas corticis]|jgi:EAL domain-containing protein (putative c-di-GMP-specific phosphodiesterase class I)/GGDEF domain-containing protein|uniref:EAL domain-containing protein n=1 Tax=Sphingomonas corticis TaxID=2722791 RepID=A0ABX1CUC5_9SPHN|nr:EAL domain-containing protein [Sphingomonas corticis]NJR79565.1 EAL domain-containing protein [Sphingomonas corticis]